MSDTIKRVESLGISEKRGLTVSYEGLFLEVPVVREAKNPFQRISKMCTKPEKRTIMKNVSGVIKPGDFVALMGASGAGKSTLLNILSRRIRTNTGTVLYNGQTADNSQELKCNTCYIQQQDIFMGFLTVQEHLYNQVEIRLPLSAKERMKRADDIISLFNLNKIRSGQVGNIAQRAKKGISGGEKKRLSIATELLTNPALIFADEPTSGLDAFLAESVVDILAGLAAAGHTVITTIHQPSSQVFQRFNKVVLLAEGSLIYSGPRVLAIPYFSTLDRICPTFSNPADFFIESLAVDWENPEAQLQNIMNWSSHWEANGEIFMKESAGKPLLQEDYDITDISQTLHSLNHNFTLPRNPDGSTQKTPTSRIFKALLSRCWIQTVRDPGVVKLRAIHLLISAAILALCYFQLAPVAIHSKAGACFAIMIFQGFPATLTVVTAFVMQKPIILREKDASLYPVWLFYLAKMMSDFPFQTLVPILYTTIIWWSVGFNNTAERFFEAMFVCLLTTQALTSYGYFVAAFAPTVAVALAVSPLIILPFSLVSGFVINLESLHPFWIWLEAISPFKYGFHGLLIATFLDTTIDVNCPPILGIDDIANPCYGNTVLDFYQALYHQPWRWMNWLITFIITVVVRLLGLLLFVLTNLKGSGGQ